MGDYASGPRPTGKLQCEDMAIGNAGTGTAVTDTYGESIGQGDTNRQGSVSGKSDAPADDRPNGE